MLQRGLASNRVRAVIDTPIGKMMAIADERHLLSLIFTDEMDAALEQGSNVIIESIRRELAGYFARELRSFATPCRLIGTNFQQLAWQQLTHIPYGACISYKEQAQILGCATAYRAVANANAANRLLIIYPCHRVINSAGGLGGYNAGVWRKEFLINHEKY